MHSFQAQIASLVLEGVFEHDPRFKMVMIEGGFAWLPMLAWRLDKAWERMRDEVPECRRPPSEYIREHLWFTTQPMEEPEQPEHLRDTIDWIGWDKIISQRIIRTGTMTIRARRFRSGCPTRNIRRCSGIMPARCTGWHRTRTARGAATGKRGPTWDQLTA